MRRASRFGAMLLWGLLLSPAGDAQAQDGSPDLRDLRPFIMLMVDTSGSMELQINCTCSTLSCNECMPKCGASNDGLLRPPDEKKSRWMVTLEALTGEFTDYQCTPLDRTDINGATYDIGYYRRYGQPWDCTTPDGAGQSCKAFPVGGGPSGANLVQTDSGILDQYGNRARFGLMTFDGWDTYLGSKPLVDYNDYNRDRAYLQDGLWSYGSFYGSNLAQEYLRPFGGTESDTVSGSAAMRIPGHFKYPNCPTTYQMDTGARGPNATEGAMLSIDSCATPPCSMLGLADKIQEVLLDTRPWGGTPIAAMLEDLYFHLDEENTDAYASCRGTFGVLITDGKPDDDYRKFGCDCYQNADSQAAGYCGADAVKNDPLSLFCPYMKPADIARDLVMGRPGRPSQLAELHVIGLALDAEARAILDEVALEGGTNAVQDVSDQALLTQSLASIVDKAFVAVSRGVPLFHDARYPDFGDTRRYEFNTGFTVAESQGDPWEGFIERKRYACTGPDLLPVDLPPEGTPPHSDRFESRLNAQTTNRTMWTVVPATPPPIPNLLESGHPLASCGATGMDCRVATFANQSAMFLAPQPLTDLDLATGVNPTRQDVIDWMLGLPGSPRENKRLGDIFHSLPQVIGAPLNDRGDEAYNLFKEDPVVRNRALTMFVNSNDGLLHAFAVEPVIGPLGNPIYQAGEEIWSFVPPFQLKRLKDQLISHQVLLDGTPAVKDVYFSRQQLVDTNTAQYRTVLITGMRGGGNAYIALDVTDIQRPQFLWQFTDPDMGNTYGNAALVQATYGYGLGGSFTRLSRGVAILPGGMGRLADFSGDEPECDPMTQQTTSFQQPSGMGSYETLTGIGEATTIEHRTNRRCWESTGRALYFVDIETGRLIKKLHRENGRVMFPAPITGTPVAFSNEVGVEASRAFVTDADGVIWRIDMSDPTQQMEVRGSEGNDFLDEWTARPFHDMFYDGGPNGGEVSQWPPVLTKDDAGNLVVLVGTGDTDNFAKINAENRVVSVAEVLKPGLPADDPDNFQAALNWQLMTQSQFPGLAISELVTGGLTLDEETVYFSSFISVPGADPCDYGRARMWAVDVAKRGTANNQASPVTYSPQLFDVYAGQMIPDDQKLINIAQADAKEDLLLQTPAIDNGASCAVVNTSQVLVDFGEGLDPGDYNVTVESGISGYVSAGENLAQAGPPVKRLVVSAASGGSGGIAAIQNNANVANASAEVAQTSKFTQVQGWAGGSD